MILEALDNSGQRPSSAPPLAEYDGQAERLDALIDAVHANTAVLIGVNSKKGKTPKVDPRPRPITAFERVKHRRRLEQHERLKSRILSPRKARSE